MILPVTTYEDVIKNFRTVISNECGIDLSRILNSLSVRGPELLKVMSDTQTYSFGLSDCFIVFELVEDNSAEDNVVLHEADGSTSSISSYNMNMRIYGNDCHKTSQDIRMTFKNPDIALNMRSNGVYIYGIPFPTSINEIVNNTVWPRCDLTIKVKVRFNKKNKAIPDITGYSEIIINTIEKASEA